MNPKRGFGAGRRPAEKGDVKQTLKRLSEYARGSVGWLVFSLLLSAAHALMTIFAPGYLGQITQIISDGLTTEIDMAAPFRTDWTPCLTRIPPFPRGRNSSSPSHGR